MSDRIPSQLSERPRGLAHQPAAEQVPRLEENLAHRPRRGAEHPGHRKTRGGLARSPADPPAAPEQLADLGGQALLEAGRVGRERARPQAGVPNASPDRAAPRPERTGPRPWPD